MAQQLAPYGHLDFRQVGHWQSLSFGIVVEESGDLTDVRLQFVVLLRGHGRGSRYLPFYPHFSLAKG